MAMYLTLNELVEKIQENVERLQAGRMELEEVEEHLDRVRELYDRTVVLKYKALEAKATKKETLAPILETPTEAVVEPVSANTVVEEEVEVVTPVQTEPTTEEESEEAVEFDLFGSMFAKEDTIEEPTEELTTPIAEETTVEMVTPVVEAVSAMEEVVAPIVEPTPEVIEPVAPTVVEPIITNTVATEEIVLPKHLAVFPKRLMEINAEATNQFGFSPLNTLIGSFGLNERLLYINELFSGSSESFSDAVKEFDGLKGLNEAVPVIVKYADANFWDVESSTVEEFMQKLSRRYA